MPGDFFDTNILLYLTSSDTRKAECVEQLLADGGIVSVQVLTEFANVARRKMRLSWNDTRRLLAYLRELLIVHPITIDIHESGLALAERYSLSIYDATIAASALHAECDRLWSEDFQYGFRVGRLRISNPFRAK